MQIFQLTPLLEGRQNARHTNSVSCLFQLSPLLEGRRGTCEDRAGAKQISTLAHTPGATKKYGFYLYKGKISTLATTRGATNID